MPKKKSAILMVVGLCLCLFSFSLFPKVLSMQSLPSVMSTSGVVVYSTSPEPPAPPPSQSDYFAYNGWEQLAIGKNWGRDRINDWRDWQDGPAKYGGVDCQYNPTDDCGYAEVVASFSDSYGFTPPNAGSKCVRMVNDRGASDAGSYRWHWNFRPYTSSHPLYWEVFQSYWIYFGSDYFPTSDWWVYFWQFKEFMPSGYNRECGIEFEKSPGSEFGDSSTRWKVYVDKPDVGGGTGQEANYYIYSDHVYGTKADHVTVEYAASGFEVPVGRWFRLEIYLLRKTDNTGIFKIWITDPNNPDPSRRDCTLLFSAENVRTARSGGYGCEYLWMYIRGTSGSIYADEFYIYDYNAHES